MTDDPSKIGSNETIAPKGRDNAGNEYFPAHRLWQVYRRQAVATIREVKLPSPNCRPSGTRAY